MLTQQNTNCPYCDAGQDKLTSGDDATTNKIWIVCTMCEAQGPKRTSIADALAAFHIRAVPYVKIENLFAIAYGYDKFLLTHEQFVQWSAIEGGAVLFDRVKEKRRLLQEWNLLPPSRYVDDQRSL